MSTARFLPSLPASLLPAQLVAQNHSSFHSEWRCDNPGEYLEVKNAYLLFPNQWWVSPRPFGSVSSPQSQGKVRESPLPCFPALTQPLLPALPSIRTSGPDSYKKFSLTTKCCNFNHIQQPQDHPSEFSWPCQTWHVQGAVVKSHG